MRDKLDALELEQERMESRFRTGGLRVWVHAGFEERPVEFGHIHQRRLQQRQDAAGMAFDHFIGRQGAENTPGGFDHKTVGVDPRGNIALGQLHQAQGFATDLMSQPEEL